MINPCTKFEDATPIPLCLSYATIENVLAATAYEPYHVTRAHGENFPCIFEVRDSDFFSHLATFMVLRSE